MNGFFAMISRMKYINRWALMRNAHSENLCEHSFEVSVIAHALVTLHNSKFGGSLDPERAAVLGLFHDAPESLTGDLPTPVKYDNDSLRQAYKAVEENACSALISMLPEELQDSYTPLFVHADSDLPLWRFVKAADKISALIKCIDERKSGNTEFCAAEKSTLEYIRKMDMPEADYFLENFIPSYGMTLDDLKK
ncbi:MAG: 5'-deoxynucleotidase [Clostridiales bacterium]|nr:5'-deoxynucleotidase [Clostridiales bacterium]